MCHTYIYAYILIHSNTIVIHTIYIRIHTDTFQYNRDTYNTYIQFILHLSMPWATPRAMPRACMFVYVYVCINTYTIHTIYIHTNTMHIQSYTYTYICIQTYLHIVGHRSRQCPTTPPTRVHLLRRSNPWYGRSCRVSPNCPSDRRSVTTES